MRKEGAVGRTGQQGGPGAGRARQGLRPGKAAALREGARGGRTGQRSDRLWSCGSRWQRVPEGAAGQAKGWVSPSGFPQFLVFFTPKKATPACPLSMPGGDSLWWPTRSVDRQDPSGAARAPHRSDCAVWLACPRAAKVPSPGADPDCWPAPTQTFLPATGRCRVTVTQGRRRQLGTSRDSQLPNRPHESALGRTGKPL